MLARWWFWIAACSLGHRPVLQTGEASFYGEAFAGRPTASGAIFDPDAMTAAHRTLPLGTEVEVVRTTTGASVVVTINDRGPYAGDRVLDLSRAAATKLGFVDEGVTQVEIRLVTCPEGERCGVR
ncbi:MAG: septal ring lytic transglycosylase RlpA family protein [Myxococcota bacterium]